MRALFPILAVLTAAAPACTAINPDCDAAMLACYAKHPDAWEKECLAKIDFAQRPDMAPSVNGLGWECMSNADCQPTWTFPNGVTLPLQCHAAGKGYLCCTESRPNEWDCAN